MERRKFIKYVGAISAVINLIPFISFAKNKDKLVATGEVKGVFEFFKYEDRQGYGEWRRTDYANKINEMLFTKQIKKQADAAYQHFLKKWRDEKRLKRLRKQYSKEELMPYGKFSGEITDSEFFDDCHWLWCEYPNEGGLGRYIEIPGKYVGVR